MLNCYADDTAFVIGANSPSRLQHRICGLLQEVSTVLAEGGLELSAKKTKVVIFNGLIIRDLCPNILQYTVSRRSMKSHGRLKYLGIIMGDQLTWKDHIEYLMAKS